AGRETRKGTVITCTDWASWSLLSTSSNWSFSSLWTRLASIYKLSFISQCTDTSRRTPHTLGPGKTSRSVGTRNSWWARY
ncbi:hypothetical protein PFISCL1PPCAC_24813, partial [Pristionchus fissidentatus]